MRMDQNQSTVFQGTGGEWYIIKGGDSGKFYQNTKYKENLKKEIAHIINW
jgi:hypothetical protein